MEAILNFINKEKANGIVLLSVIFLGLFLNSKTNEIEKHLTNHVTGTERKIEKLDSKIDQFKTETHKKLDDNFKHINTRLDSFISFNRQQNNVSKRKRK